MLRALTALLILVLPAAAGATSSSVVASSRDGALPAPPGVLGGAVGGFLNPAAWSLGAGEIAFTWDDRSLQSDRLDDWGLSLASPLGFAVRHQSFLDATGSPATLWDYRVGLSWGDRAVNAGVGYRWTGGDAGAAGAEDGLLLGTIHRPARWLSLGSSVFLSTESGFREGQLDLGLRPFRTDVLTLVADGSMARGDRLADAPWSAGALVRPVRGIELGGRVRETPDHESQDWLLSVGLTWGGIGAHVLPSFDKNGDLGTTSYLVRLRPPYRGSSVPRLSSTPRRVLAVSLVDKTVSYKKDLWFDDDRVAWLDLLEAIRRVRDDPCLAGIAIDFSGAHTRTSIAWELRHELTGLRSAGKKVLLHFDEMRMSSCYFAAAADRVTIDPLGMVELPGLAIQRTYLKGMLDKAGLGFEEHRLFRYKSAAETYSRRDMSDADKEQLGRLDDVIYEELRDGIATRRGLDAARVDSLVNGPGILLPDRALDVGLVDAVDRWDDLENWARGEGLVFVSGTADRSYPDERWGAPPVVALVYAEGVCDVKEGIRARAMAKALERLAKRSDVAAVVLRADSPGGDALASDLVADGLATIRDGGKPVVVTQGDVAGSGGYWISLDADRVLTTPLTVTGSIGVISGWVWNQGFGDKTGISADGVQRGKHADLFAGMRIPLLGQRLPLRNLDAQERAIVDSTISTLYGRFVAKVADLRALPDDSVRVIAQGRVWAGADAVKLGLCDGLGGLGDALDEARRRAGLSPTEEIRIEEWPPRRFFHIPSSLSGIPGLKTLLAVASPLSAAAHAAESEEDQDYDMLYLRSLIAAPGEPRVLMPPDDLPDAWKGRDSAP